MAVRGLEQVNRKLDRISAPPQAALAEAATLVKSRAATYPLQPGGRKQAFASDKHRRGFFAKLRAGEIEVPWRRGSSPGSEKHGAQWVVELGRNIARVVNGTSYGRWLQGVQQSAFHAATGWKTERQIANESAPEVKRIFENYYRDEIRR